MKQIRLLHPILFTLGSLLFLYRNAWIIASPDQLGRPLLILGIILFLLAIPLYWVVRDHDWVAIILTIIALGFFSPSLIFIFAGTFTIAILFIYYLSSRILKHRTRLQHVSTLLTFTGLLLVSVMVIPHANQFRLALDRESPVLSPVLKLTPTNQLPDIYYIVLDGYAREDVLTELYNYDNSPFIRLLETKGFIVPTESRSNYPKTALSVASTLNMDYIQSFAPGLEEQPYWWRMAPFIDNGRVRSALEGIGYRSISIASDWGITNNSTTDSYYSPRSIILSDFESFILGRTPLSSIRSLVEKFALVPSYDTHRDLIQYNFDTLAQIPALPSPKFIFAHILVPHPPFVFDAAGNPLHPNYPFSFNDGSDFPSGNDAYLQGYTKQLEYTNQQLKKLIDTILRDSKTPPIILLQADHGPGMLTDFSSSENSCLKERFSVFSAYYLPDASSEDIPIDITPVNLFRIIFNKYFQADIPLLENASYYYKDTVYIFRFEDVTTKVDTCDVK